MTTQLANRHIPPDQDWRLPVTPPEGVGIIYRSCTDRSEPLEVPIDVGVALRIGSDAYLCFRCGPDGSVYHPEGARQAENEADDDSGYIWPTMIECEAMAARIMFSDEALRLAASAAGRDMTVEAMR